MQCENTLLPAPALIFHSILEMIEYALREENRILFRKMLSECKKKEYADCTNAKVLAESLFFCFNSRNDERTSS